MSGSSKRRRRSTSVRSFPKLTMMSVSRQEGDFENAFSTSKKTKKVKEMEESAALRVAIYQSTHKKVVFSDDKQVKQSMEIDEEDEKTQDKENARKQEDQSMEMDEEDEKNEDEDNVRPPWLYPLPRFPRMTVEEKPRMIPFRLFNDEDPEEKQVFKWKQNRRLVKIVNEARVNIAMFRSSQNSSATEVDMSCSNAFDWFEDDHHTETTATTTTTNKEELVVSPIPRKTERLAPNTTAGVLETLESRTQAIDSTLDTVRTTCTTMMTEEIEVESPDNSTHLGNVKKNLRFSDDDLDKTVMIASSPLLPRTKTTFKDSPASFDYSEEVEEEAEENQHNSNSITKMDGEEADSFQFSYESYELTQTQNEQCEEDKTQVNKTTENFKVSSTSTSNMVETPKLLKENTKSGFTSNTMKENTKTIKSGFSTAGGKTLNVAASNLNKAKHGMSSEDISISMFKSSTNFNPPKAMMKENTMTPRRMQGASNVSFTTPQGGLVTPQAGKQGIRRGGLQTAGGKRIQLSESAAKSAALWLNATSSSSKDFVKPAFTPSSQRKRALSKRKKFIPPTPINRPTHNNNKPTPINNKSTPINNKSTHINNKSTHINDKPTPRKRKKNSYSKLSRLNRRSLASLEFSPIIIPRKTRDLVIMEISPDNAHRVCFNKNDDVSFRQTSTSITWETLANQEKDFCTKVWVRCHYRWIVWKLASYERTFRKELRGVLNPREILSQLRLRHQREHERAELPITRRILRRDTHSSLHMVLCVSAIRGRNTIEVTDGWYAVSAQLDELLVEQLSRGRIFVGLKLHVCGAKLVGEPDGCEPIECKPNDLNANSDPVLHLFYHGTRRAKFDARMGIVKSSPCGWISSVENLKCRGGVVGRLDAVVERIYPVRYFEKTVEGGRFLSEYEEEMAQLSHELQCEQLWEKKKMLLEKTGVSSDISSEIPERSSTTTLTILLTCCHSLSKTKRRCMLTIWDLGEELRDRLVEGNRVRIRNLIPTERSLFRGGPIQLQTQRRLTRWIDAEEATKDCLVRSTFYT